MIVTSGMLREVLGLEHSEVTSTMQWLKRYCTVSTVELPVVFSGQYRLKDIAVISLEQAQGVAEMLLDAKRPSTSRAARTCLNRLLRLEREYRDIYDVTIKTYTEEELAAKTKAQNKKYADVRRSLILDKPARQARFLEKFKQYNKDKYETERTM